MFMTLLLNKWVWVAVALGVLTLGITLQTHRLNSAQARVVEIQAKYNLFVESVRQAGEAQIAKNKEMVAKQEKANAQASKSYESRLATINAEYARLRDSKAGSGQRPMPPAADAPKPVTNTAVNDELLAVLREAETNTLKLLEIQSWLRGVSP